MIQCLYINFLTHRWATVQSTNLNAFTLEGEISALWGRYRKFTTLRILDSLISHDLSKISKIFQRTFLLCLIQSFSLYKFYCNIFSGTRFPWTCILFKKAHFGLILEIFGIENVPHVRKSNFYGQKIIFWPKILLLCLNPKYNEKFDILTIVTQIFLGGGKYGPYLPPPSLWTIHIYQNFSGMSCKVFENQQEEENFEKVKEYFFKVDG